METKRRVWLLAPALLLYCADIALTLLGQLPEYYSGDHMRAIELNPIAGPLLRRGPNWFLTAAITWSLAFSALIVFSRIAIARVAAYLITLGHAVGSASWLVRYGTVGWIAAICLLVAAAWVARLCWRRAIDRLK